MKILFIHNNYATNNSGEEHAAESLKEILEHNGHQVRWFRRFSDIINDSFLRKVQAFFSGVYNPIAVRELKVLLDEFQPDVVQVQNLYPFISPGIVKTIKRRGIPLVMRCPNYRLFCPTGLHLDGQGTICEKCLCGSRELNCIIKNCENDVPKSVGYALRNFLARTFWHVTSAMDAYIVQSAFQKQKFIDNGIPANKLFVLPGLSSKNSISKSTVIPEYVTFIGRASEEKGIKEFIRAASFLPNIPFVIAGSMPKKLSYLIDEFPINLEWRGFIAGKQLDDLYASSKIIVVPSKWYEGFPNVLTNAMKHGKAIITSNLGAMANIIEHNETGILVQPGDVIGLTGAIKDLFEDDEKRSLLGSNAQKKAALRYNSTRVYDQLLHLYNALLKEKERKSKNILAILHYPPPVHGAAMVGKYIMDSDFINSKLYIHYINLGTSIRVDEIGHGGIRKIRRYFKIIFSVLKYLVLKKTKLVYVTLTATGGGFYKDALIVLLVKLFKVKVVFHFHNKGVVTRQEKKLDNLLYKLVFNKAYVLLLSKYLYSDIEKYVPQENVFYCPNGIPINDNVKNKLKLTKSKVSLLFLSNLIESKGVYILLNACRILKQRNITFSCTFIGNVGDINGDMFYAKVKELDLDDCVFYEGPKYGLEKESAYLSSDIFVFPTHYSNETFGLVNLEAMQFSLPIVSTFEGGIPDVVLDGKTGFLIEKKDSNDLADKLEILINDPGLRMKMGKEGRKHYEENFTLEKFEDRFYQLMEALTK